MPSFVRLLFRSCLGGILVLGTAALGAPAVTGEPALSLDEAIRLALAKNFAIRIQSHEAKLAKEGVSEALGRFDVSLKGRYSNQRIEDPQLAGLPSQPRPGADITDTESMELGLEGFLPTGATYSIGGSQVNARDSDTGFVDTYSSFAGIRFTQPLLRDGGTTAGLYQVRVAKTNRQLSDWEYRQTVTNIVTQVIYSFSELHFAHARLRSAKRSHELATQLQKENERRFSVGERSEYEIISAKARVATREEAILNAEHHVRIAENALRQLISDKTDATLLSDSLLPAPLTLEMSQEIKPAEDFRSALENRPDYRMAELGVRKGELDRSFSKNQALPRVDFVGSYGYAGVGYDYAGSRSDLRTKDFGNFSTGVVLSIPLGAVSERSRLRSSKLRLLQAQDYLRKLEQSIVVDISNAAAQVESTRKRMESTRMARELNEQTLEAEIKRLRAGAGTTFSVLYQQEQLNGAEIGEALARSDHLKALAEYDRQTGRTLSNHHISLTQ